MSKAKEQNAKGAGLLGAIWCLSEGDVSKFVAPGPVPKEIKGFLGSGPSMRARRAALLAILQSIITDEAKSSYTTHDK